MPLLDLVQVKMQLFWVYFGRRRDRPILHLVSVEGVGASERLNVDTVGNVPELMLEVIGVVVRAILAALRLASVTFSSRVLT